MPESRCAVEVSALPAHSADAGWDVLADAPSIASWVVGTAEVRYATPGGPAVGSAGSTR